ncbi:5,6-dimethylbenzimidazole synthase [Pelagibius litoralis]|uniref:5,6-dimethylbenzimidazole synthase n=1 Tax=Pelagibius litoralis TaxID=374515 RepID=A0A967F0K4_9PROT|nr:5,6-dimethylbenzimidazole synthase [Pelagibius litoralis]NIA70795.1 5,6-dimethylbenzimidazole synthase [Pelagibius litoralis]
MKAESPSPPSGPDFSPEFQARLEELLVWRRDVRRFRGDALPEGLLERLLGLAELAPSVGLSQPWRFVRVIGPEARGCVVENFEAANAEALADYAGDRAALYARLKLSGLREAPEQLAVFADLAPEAGQGLGRRTMPETLQYSTVCAIHTLWLAARAAGVGLGWVSILDPLRIGRDLAVPETWSLVAYLCLGYPEEAHDDPELQRHGWQAREAAGPVLLTR